jgi:hypothetical protein
MERGRLAKEECCRRRLVVVVWLVVLLTSSDGNRITVVVSVGCRLLGPMRFQSAASASLIPDVELSPLCVCVSCFPFAKTHLSASSASASHTHAQHTQRPCANYAFQHRSFSSCCKLPTVRLYKHRLGAMASSGGGVVFADIITCSETAPSAANSLSPDNVQAGPFCFRRSYEHSSFHATVLLFIDSTSWVEEKDGRPASQPIRL